MYIIFSGQYETKVADPKTNYVIKAPRIVCSELSEYTDLVFIISLSYCGDPGFGSDQ